MDRVGAAAQLKIWKWITLSPAGNRADSLRLRSGPAEPKLEKKNCPNARFCAKSAIRKNHSKNGKIERTMANPACTKTMDVDAICALPGFGISGVSAGP